MMVRKPRTHYEGALCYVITRGNSKEKGIR